MVQLRKPLTNSEISLFWKYINNRSIPTKKAHIQICSKCVDHCIAEENKKKNDDGVQKLIKFKSLLWN